MTTTTIHPTNPLSSVPEPLWSKQQVANYYGYSVRWVETMTAKGMPSRMIGGQRRYRFSLIDAWLDAFAQAA